MNIYLHELKFNYKSVLIWVSVAIVLMLFYIAFYSSFSIDMNSFVELMDNLPDAMKSAMGIDISIIGSILGYYAFILIVILVCMSVQSIILGLSILSKEERGKIADFLLTKPISRIKIITAKLLSSLTIILFINIILFISNYLILLTVGGEVFNFKVYTLLTLPILFIQLLFFAIGFLISVILKKIKTVLPIAMGIVFGFYFLSMFGDEKLKVIMPFKYFDATEIILNIKYDIKYLIITFSFILISIVLSYIIYNKKDIYIT